MAQFQQVMFSASFGPLMSVSRLKEFSVLCGWNGQFNGKMKCPIEMEEKRLVGKGPDPSFLSSQNNIMENILEHCHAQKRIVVPCSDFFFETVNAGR